MPPERMTTDTNRWDDRTKKLVAATVGKGLDAASLAQLEHISVSRGLDPLNNELYAIPKGGKATFITSINGMLKVAATQLDGVETVFYDGDGNGTPIWLPKTPPAACAVTVYRRGCQRGFTAAARFDDYKGSNLWQKMPSTMIRKVALASALRLGFSDLLAGLYASEEMDQAGFSRPEPVAAPAPEKIKMHGREFDSPEDVEKFEAREMAKARQKQVDDHDAAEQSKAVKKLEETFAGKEAERSGASSTKKDSPEPPSQASTEEVAPAADAKASDELPERTDLKGAVGALYKQARISKLTPAGWATLEKQCGGEIATAAAAKALPALKDPEKVAHLNAGRKTTGAEF